MLSANVNKNDHPKSHKNKLQKKASKKNVPKANEKNTKKKQKNVITSVRSVRSPCSFYMDRRGISEDEDSEPDRSNPTWKLVEETERDSVDSKPDTSESLPGDTETLWEEIMSEYEDKRTEYNNFIELTKAFEPPLPIRGKISAVDYLEKHIFPLLCPSLEKTLFKAKEWDCLMIQKCRFNGLDYIAELLWNLNPLHPCRQKRYLEIFDIPFAIIWLYYNPRPIYPLSWLWTKKEAVTVLQTYIRRYTVCKEPECSEMRQFWKTIKKEKEEEIKAREAESLERLEIMFNEIFDKLVADAVFEAEWKIHGCRCVKKPCHCSCKCFKWCKCCDCYKIPPHQGSPCGCFKYNN